MKLFDYANAYCKKADWKTLALLKFCLCSVGVLIGLGVPKEKRRSVAVAAVVIFFATYVPLMRDFFTTVLALRKAQREEEMDYYEMVD